MKNIYRNRVERELTVTQERWGETERNTCGIEDQISTEYGDIYNILVNGCFVVRFEVERVLGVICGVENGSVFEYSRKLRGRLSNLEMLIALDLASNH